MKKTLPLFLFLFFKSQKHINLDEVKINRKIVIANAVVSHYLSYVHAPYKYFCLCPALLLNPQKVVTLGADITL